MSETMQGSVARGASLDVATRIGLTVVVLGTAVLAVGLPLSDWLRGRPLQWTADSGLSGPVSSSLMQVRAGASVESTGQVSVSLPNAGPGLWAVSLLPGLLLTIAVVVIVAALLRLTGSIRASEPFGTASIRSLQVVATTVVVATGLTAVGSLADVVVLNGAVRDAPFAVTVLSIGQLVLIAVGLVVMLMARAFEHGGRLARDVDGLV